MKSIATHSSPVTDISYSAKTCASRDSRCWMLDARSIEFLSSIKHLGSRIIPLVALAVLCAGCHTGTLKDPNDVPTAGPDTATVIMNQLHVASDALNARKDRKEIDDRQYRLLITKIARDYIAEAKDKSINDSNAPTWGQVYMTARDWPNAEIALQQAVKAEKAPVSDFKKLGEWVDDTLALAATEAHLGKVHEAVTTARSTFFVPPKAKAPILTSVLLDIVPAALRHGGGLELADLLRDAIKQHEQVIVDPNTEGGRDFLLARPRHIQHAWEEAALLYQAAGKDAEAQQALNQAQKVSTSSANL